MSTAEAALQEAAKLAAEERMDPVEIREALRQGFLDAYRIDLAEWIMPPRPR